MDILVFFVKGKTPADFVTSDGIGWYQHPEANGFYVEGAEAWVRYMLDRADDSVVSYTVL